MHVHLPLLICWALVAFLAAFVVVSVLWRWHDRLEAGVLPATADTAPERVPEVAVAAPDTAPAAPSTTASHATTSMTASQPPQNGVQPVASPGAATLPAEVSAVMAESLTPEPDGDRQVRLDSPEGRYMIEHLGKAERVTVTGKIGTLELRGIDGGSNVAVEGIQAAEIIVGGINGSSSLRLTGKARVLRLAGVNGESSVDASGLDAAEITVAGDINGESDLDLCAPGGTVEIKGQVNGGSTAAIEAPGGTVLMGQADGSSIGGESRLTVRAGRLDLRGSADGTSTLVDVTLSKGGSLRFSRLQGGVRLIYRRSDVNDPAPTIERGTITAAAKVEEDTD